MAERAAPDPLARVGGELKVTGPLGSCKEIKLKTKKMMMPTFYPVQRAL